MYIYIYIEREREREREERDIDIYMYDQYTTFGHKSNSSDDSHCNLCLTSYKSTEVEHFEQCSTSGYFFSFLNNLL